MLMRKIDENLGVGVEILVIKVQKHMIVSSLISGVIRCVSVIV